MALDPVLVLRRQVDETEADSIYTDAELTDRLLAASSGYAAARDIWFEKVSSMTGFVNVSEGGSSRSMSQAFDHAQKMAQFYSGLADSASQGSPTGAVIRAVTRV
jgi:hypothetical protein